MKIYHCDYCNKNMEEHQGDIRFSFSYGSRYDMCYIEVDICDDCFEQKFPEIKDKINKMYMGDMGGED